jgi:hypothetical protein
MMVILAGVEERASAQAAQWMSNKPDLGPTRCTSTQHRARGFYRRKHGNGADKANQPAHQNDPSVWVVAPDP